jgi:replicative DNA helicase
MADSKIELDYLPNLDINSLRNMIMRFVIKHNCKMVILDYLQLVSTSKNMNKTDGIGEITQMLKGLSIQFDIPIIILAQLNREVEKRSGDHKPLLSDLKDSGSIEADCDMVLFPYRPEYYEIKEDMNGNSLLDQTIIIVAKHRGGKLGEGTIFHNLWCSRYYSTYEQMIEGRGKFGKSLIPLANEPDPFYSAGLSEFGI